MSRKSNEAILADLHQDALAEFDLIQTAVKDERLMCLQDRRFYSIAGAMWEGELLEQFDNKMRFEINKVHLSVIRIFNEYRNNRITVTFYPKHGEEDNGLADTCAGLYRATETDSSAEEAFDNAFEEAVGGGYGAFRLTSEYEDEEDDEDDQQKILIKPIFDADSCVFFDLGAKRQDKADAKKCFVLTPMTPAAYEEEYGDDPSSWSKEVHQREFDWSTSDTVYVAEYYVVESVKSTVHIWEALNKVRTSYQAEEFEADPELRNTLTTTGSREVRVKKVTKKKVHKYLLSGSKILEDCGYIAGQHIPIVPVFGKRWFIDNIERCMGHVRLAKDPQRLKNVQVSQIAEISARSSVQKPIFTPEQIAGHQVMWEDDAVKDYAYLLVNPITDANGQLVATGPIAYTKAPDIPPAMAALLQITEQDMREILGNQQEGEKIVSNISSKTVEAVQEQLGMQTFIYVSNMAKAVKRGGEIWLSMAKDLYIEEGRKMKSMGMQGEIDSVELMRPMVGKNGEDVYENDLSSVDMDVAVDVGPNSISKRNTIVRNLKEMMSLSTDPQTISVLSAMVMMNMEGEGIKDVRDYFRQKLIRMGVVKPSKEEAESLAQEQANQPPDPNAEFLKAAAEEAAAKATKAKADTIKVLTDSDKVRAEIMEILAGIDQAEQQNILQAITMLANTQPIVEDEDWLRTHPDYPGFQLQNA